MVWRVTKTIAERFYEKVEPVTESGCWIWTGGISTKTGYGSMSIRHGAGDHSNESAHRISFFVHNGRWPRKGMCVIHSCDVRCCANPAHLREGTFQENMLDMIQKKRNRPTTRAVCKRGHPRTPDNLIGKHCRICHRMAGRRTTARKKAARAVKEVA